MSISLLKRYKNEVKTVLSKTKKLIKAEWGDDFEILFTIKSPYSGYDYDSNDGATSCSITLRVNKVFANKELVGKIKAVEDNGLVYLGVDLDKGFINSVINSYLSYEFNGDIDYFVAKDFIRDVIWDRERFKFREYSSKNIFLTHYDKPLLLGDIETYADYGIMAKKNDDGEIEFVDPGWRYQFLLDFLSNNLSMIKNLDYFKGCRKEVSNLFSNLNISLADGEFPKLSNRNFLPIVTINFNKNEVSYLYNSKHVNREVSFPAYSKGLMRLEIETFLKGGGGNYIIPPTNTLEMEYMGKKCRCNDGSRISINFSV